MTRTSVSGRHELVLLIAELYPMHDFCLQSVMMREVREQDTLTLVHFILRICSDPLLDRWLEIGS
jgi:hypothetical protein